MSNECGNPKILICPFEPERWSNIMSDFNMGVSLMTNSLASKSNAAVSFFASLDADETTPTVILSGDRHLLTNRFNLDGRLFLASSNVTSASWIPSHHDGLGNYALSDGSVQQYTSAKMRTGIASSGDTTAWTYFP